jgi:hypothetical protein
MLDSPLMKKILQLMILCFVFLSFSFAQNSGESPASEPKGKVARFVYTSLPEGVTNPISIMHGEELVKVHLSLRSPSETVKIPADGIIRIVSEQPNPEDPTKPKMVSIGLAKVPETISNFLVILIPSSDKKNGMLLQTKVVDFANYKGGNNLFLNMSRMKIAVDFAKTSIEIDPSEHKIYDAPATLNPESVQMRFRFLDPETKKWQVITGSTIVMYPTRREMCIFGWDAEFNRINYRGITIPVDPE